MALTQPVPLLWTGGWDSTFRLLELVLVQDEVVQPYYLIALSRRSSLMELQAMASIRNACDRLRPGSAERIRPSVIVAVHDLAPDGEASKQLAVLRSEAHVGPQYEWLARLASQYDLDGLELSVHIDDKAAYFLDGNVVQVSDGSERGTWALDETARGSSLALFERFQFPLLRLSKTGMREIAGSHGFAHILELTWFCHSRLTKPCGMCPPCQYAQEEGMAHRIPRLRRSWPYRAGWRAAKAVQAIALRVRS